MLKNYGGKKREIYCLVADNLKTTIIKKSLKGTNEYYIKIKINLDIADFTKAEIKNIELEKQEEQFTWQEEMEQYVYKPIEPGEEISRAYRYLRKNEWRIAIIYLDHLQKKYPNWHEIYFAKAIGYYAENKPKAMINALHTSCSLGNREACEDLKGFSENHKEIKFE
jgi:tetratricopeptide (TPR) repeat protein